MQWITKDRRKMKIKDMDTAHIISAITIINKQFDADFPVTGERDVLKDALKRAMAYQQEILEKCEYLKKENEHLESARQCNAYWRWHYIDERKKALANLDKHTHKVRRSRNTF